MVKGKLKIGEDELDKFEQIQRLLTRKISLPDKYIHSFYLSEIFTCITKQDVTKKRKSIMRICFI